MNVSAIIVTRGDVDLAPVLSSLPNEWEKYVWDNGLGRIYCPDSVPVWGRSVSDLSVYGRYAAIEHASHDLIYVQDDDCVVSDPYEIVRTWEMVYGEGSWEAGHGASGVVCNMPSEFRHDFYVDHALVGFGAAFHRTAPDRAFERFWGFQHVLGVEAYHRTCDIVFTALTPRVLVDVPKIDLPHAHHDNRMWRQAEHQVERARMLELCKEVLRARA